MMPEETSFPSPEASAGLQKRLEAYARYAAVVRAQFQALQEEDVSRFSELAGQRQEIQDSLDEVDPQEPGAGPGDHQEEELLKGVRNDLVEVLALDREIQRKLTRLRGQVASQLRDISSRTGSAREYLSRDAGPEPTHGTRVNVRF